MSDAAEQPATVRRYIFFTEHRPSRAWLPTLEAINDRFSQYLRSSLLQYLPTGIEITPLIPIELVNHDELNERFEIPSHLTLVNLPPLRGTILVVFDAPLVAWIVETRFGGTGRFPVTTINREFTAFEYKAMRAIVDATLQQFVLAWQPIAGLAPDVMRHEINPQFAEIAAAGELVIVNAFDVKICRGGGKLTVCIPYAMLEPLHDQLVAGTVKRAVDHDQHWREVLTNGVGQATMRLDVELAKIEVTMGDLLQLRPGTVFDIERPEKVIVEANGFPLFRGRWGRVGRKIGVRIEEHLLSPAELADASAIEGEK